jgi:hypothetical protein
MTSATPAHDFLLPRLTALVDAAVSTGLARDVVVAVLIDLITAAPFNTVDLDASQDVDPGPDFVRTPDDPVLVGGESVNAPHETGGRPDADFVVWPVR